MTIDTYVARGMTTLGIYRAITFKATGPASYTTTGHAVGAAQLGLVPEVMPDLMLQSGSAVRLAVYDYVNGKYLIFVPDTGAEVAAGTNLSTFTARGLAIGS